MISCCGHSLILAWLIIVYTIGVLFFTKGFLLKRTVIEKKSECKVNFSSSFNLSYNMINDTVHHESTYTEVPGCWLHHRFSKTIVLIVDALRFDFVKNKYDDTAQLPYHNKMKTINQLLKRKPYHSRLYKFIADPPTTTMQRLKGLTTGSLPTFVDASSNFASAEISEDNIIDSLVSLNKKIVFMGDDTWESLYPGRFYRSYFYPSFDVKDLHTVDNGVTKYLVPEIQTSDWDVIVAHYLGVDHCGHRYGPNHPAMADKLNEMDEIIRSVVREMTNDTLLIVMGDHGMTRTGDHGGDSPDELNAALFVYSPKQLTATPAKRNKNYHIAQIDLVPTIALLLGLPIPFSNLGTVVPELFNHCPWWEKNGTKIQQIYHSIEALRLNAHQIRTYIKSYQEQADDFPQLKAVEFDILFGRTEDQLQHALTMLQIEAPQDDELLGLFQKIHDNYQAYLQGIKEMCQQIWAKFDTTCIILGILMLLLTVLLTIYRIIYIGDDNEKISGVVAFISTLWLVLYFSFLYAVDLRMRGLVIALIVGLSIMTISLVLFIKVKNPSKATLLKPDGPLKTKVSSLQAYLSDMRIIDWMSLVLLLLNLLGMFSNSFVVYEDHVVSYLLITSVFLHVIASIHSIVQKSQSTNVVISRKSGDGISSRHKSRSQTSTIDLGYFLTSPQTMLCALFIIFAVCVRFSTYFRACREEQWQCVDSPFLRSISALNTGSGQPQNLRYVFSISCLVVIVLVTRYYLRYRGNLNGTSPAVLVASYTPTLTAVSIGLYWALQALPQKIYDSLPTWQLVMLPQLVYLLVIISVIILVIKPLSILVILRNAENPMTAGFIHGGDSSQIIPRLCNHIKSNWKGSFSGSEAPDSKPPLVYGLATVFSSTQITLLVAIVLLLCMMLGDGLVFSLLLQVGALFIFLEIHAHLVKEGDNIHRVSLSSTITLGFLAVQFFYASGHQSTVTTLHWHAAYVGFHGNFNYYIIPAILMVLNTFSSYLVTVVAIPLLAYWPFVNGKLPNVWDRSLKKVDSMQERGEFELQEQKTLSTIMIKYVMYFFIMFALRLVACTAAAGIHRRHLMVWKIFAPKFVYEVSTFYIVSVSLLAIYLFTMRVSKCIKNWTDTLQ